MRSSREKALPLLSSGVSSKAGPEWWIYSGSVLVMVVSSNFLRIVLYPLGLLFDAEMSAKSEVSNCASVRFFAGIQWARKRPGSDTTDHKIPLKDFH